LAFSYWIDNLGFIIEGKLAAIFIKPSLRVSNWPVIYFINNTPTSSLALFNTTPSTPKLDFASHGATQAPQRLRLGSPKKAAGYQSRPMFLVWNCIITHQAPTSSCVYSNIASR
jgi:hypothetical protein